MWYKIVGKSCCRFVTIHAFDRRTDRQTDRQTDEETDGPQGLGNTVRKISYAVRDRHSLYAVRFW